jgi:hypothetical protein
MMIKEADRELAHQTSGEGVSKRERNVDPFSAWSVEAISMHGRIREALGASRRLLDEVNSMGALFAIYLRILDLEI